MKVYRGREGYKNADGKWIDSGFSQGIPDNRGLEKPFLTLVELKDIEPLVEALQKIARGLIVQYGKKEEMKIQLRPEQIAKEALLKAGIKT